MDEITWTVTETNGKTTVQGSTKKLAYRDEIAITDKMPKGQLIFAEGWNEMRAKLLELNEMESK